MGAHQLYLVHVFFKGLGVVVDSVNFILGHGILCVLLYTVLVFTVSIHIFEDGEQEIPVREVGLRCGSRRGQKPQAQHQGQHKG